MLQAEEPGHDGPGAREGHSQHMGTARASGGGPAPQAPRPQAPRPQTPRPQAPSLMPFLTLLPLSHRVRPLSLVSGPFRHRDAVCFFRNGLTREPQSLCSLHVGTRNCPRPNTGWGSPEYCRWVHHGCVVGSPAKATNHQSINQSWDGCSKSYDFLNRTPSVPLPRTQGCQIDSNQYRDSQPKLRGGGGINYKQ